MHPHAQSKQRLPTGRFVYRRRSTCVLLQLIKVFFRFGALIWAEEYNLIDFWLDFIKVQELCRF